MYPIKGVPEKESSGSASRTLSLMATEGSRDPAICRLLGNKLCNVGC